MCSNSQRNTPRPYIQLSLWHLHSLLILHNLYTFLCADFHDLLFDRHQQGHGFALNAMLMSVDSYERLHQIFNDRSKSESHYSNTAAAAASSSASYLLYIAHYYRLFYGLSDS